MPQLEEFEYDGEFAQDGMADWFEVYNPDETDAWLASDTTMEVRQ